MLESSKDRLIYLISGPIGVGKSTTSKELAGNIEHCVLIEGDVLLHLFMSEPTPSFEEKVALAWMNILSATRNFIERGFHIVIDFVVEDELEWFCKQISDLDVSLKYAVLHAKEGTIVERLNKRGDIHSLQRSLFLLNKLETSPLNAPYLVDTTGKQTSEIVEDILHSDRFHKKLEG